MILHLFATHVQAWEGDAHIIARQKQLRHLKRFYDQMSIPLHEPVMFCGDFNIDLFDHSGEYASLVEMLDCDNYMNNDVWGGWPGSPSASVSLARGSSQRLSTASASSAASGSTATGGAEGASSSSSLGAVGENVNNNREKVDTPTIRSDLVIRTPRNIASLNRNRGMPSLELPNRLNVQWEHFYSSRTKIFGTKRDSRPALRLTPDRSRPTTAPPARPVSPPPGSSNRERGRSDSPSRIGGGHFPPGGSTNKGKASPPKEPKKKRGKEGGAPSGSSSSGAAPPETKTPDMDPDVFQSPVSSREMSASKSLTVQGPKPKRSAVRKVIGTEQDPIRSPATWCCTADLTNQWVKIGGVSTQRVSV